MVIGGWGGRSNGASEDQVDLISLDPENYPVPEQLRNFRLQSVCTLEEVF
jgi:hypothetical protein